MLSWRPLGMLAFGLTVIYLFIRLHGDGYDFPIRVAKCWDELDFQRRPDRTYVEVSSLDPDGRNWNSEELMAHTKRARSQKDDISHHQQNNAGNAEATMDLSEEKEGGQRFIVGWNTQWHLGKKWLKDRVVEKDPPSVRDQEIAKETQSTFEGSQGEQWVWMTNIWHNDGECGPGHLRQYRRPLSKVLTSDNTTAWELMYTHKLPGIVTHSSMSKRVIPEYYDQDTGRVQRHRELVRLAVLYKVVQDESVAYHSRVYHFGSFQRKGSDTSPSHAPFLSFDYVLPGSTPIKDFTLEHDTILYSRLSDTALFRTLHLTKLKAGFTSPEQPLVLSNGEPGPALSCKERKALPHRMSFLSAVPSPSGSHDLHVLMAQVQEYQDSWEYQDGWEYQVAIASQNTPDSKKWTLEPQLAPRYPALVQEHDIINDEPHIYGTPMQVPFVVKSADGASLHLPIKDTIYSLDSQPELYKETIGSHGQKKKLVERHGSLTALFWDRWTKSALEVSMMEAVETEQGVLNDDKDIMVLKTTKNGVLVLKRKAEAQEGQSTAWTPWKLSMIMNDEFYNPMMPGANAKREVLALKIIQAPLPVLAAPKDETEGSTSETIESDTETSPEANTVEEDAVPEAAPAMHNILLMIFRDGKVVSYNLDQSEVSSSTMMFLQEKYPVVLGMLAVVVAFVMNESR